jgi:hypothetical protein
VVGLRITPTTTLQKFGEMFLDEMSRFIFRPAKKWYTVIDFPNTSDSPRTKKKLKLQDLVSIS